MEKEENKLPLQIFPLRYCYFSRLYETKNITNKKNNNCNNVENTFWGL